MHMILHPEVKQSLTMLRYLMYTRKRLHINRRCTNLIIPLMKMSASLFVEIVLIIMISQQDNVQDIIKDFVALGFIIEVDNILSANFDYPLIQQKMDEINEKGGLEIDVKPEFMCWLWSNMVP